MPFVLTLGLSVLAGVLVGPRLVALCDRVPVREPAGPAGADDEGPYPSVPRWVVRVGAPVLFALAAFRWGDSSVLVPFLFLYAVLLVVSVIDIEHHRIQDRITFPALGISVAMIAAVSVIEGVPGALLRALLGGVVAYVFMLIPFLVHPRGLGYGDVKLARLMGLYLGWIFFDPIASVSLVLMALMIGSLLGVLVGGTMTVVRRKRSEFPFGPALAAGCIIAVQYSHHLINVS